MLNSCAAEVRTSEFAVAANAALLRSVAEVASSLAPPPGWKPPKAASQPRPRNGRRSSTSKSAKPEKGVAKITIVTAIVAFEDISLAYSARVEVPAKFRKHGACGAARCELQFGIGRLAVAARPAANRADVEVADVMLTYTENDDAGALFSTASLLRYLPCNGSSCPLGKSRLGLCKEGPKEGNVFSSCQRTKLLEFWWWEDLDPLQWDCCRF